MSPNSPAKGDTLTQKTVSPNSPAKADTLTQATVSPNSPAKGDTLTQAIVSPNSPAKGDTLTHRGETIHRNYGASRFSGHDSVYDSFSPSFNTVRFTQV